MNYPKRNEALAKKLNIYAYIISAAVLALVGVMRRVKIDLGVDFSFLPPIHAILNTLAAISLIAAFLYIKKGKVEAHRKAIYAAMLCSFLFLLCYVLYHFTTVETKYCGDGTMKTVYFILLISHIVLAGVSLPFILLTFIKGYTGMVAEHKRMAKWVYPIWLYVAITGPLCYLILAPCYR
jgi:putative membrane protein